MVFRKQRNQKIAINFKSLPSIFAVENTEFQPAAPCKNCFPKSHNQAEVLEELGVSNLFKSSLKQPEHQKQLGSIVKLVQAHRAQIEFLNEFNYHKVFVTAKSVNITLQNEEIIKFCLGLAQETRKLQIFTSNNIQSIGSFFWSHPESDALLLLGTRMLFSNMLKELLQSGLAEKTRLVIMSSANEYYQPGDNKQLPPVVDMRINFSQPYFMSDLLSISNTEDILSHFYHGEIWKNTPVMMSHVTSFLSRYQKYSKETSFDDWKTGIKSIRDLLQNKFDLAGVGDFKDITQHSVKYLESPAASLYFPSVVLDSVKHLAIMAKSIFVSIDDNICHSETLQLKKNSVLETFRSITRLLRNELEFIHPPCVSAASIESKTLEHFVLAGIISDSSDEVLTVESRIAKNMARYLDIDSDEDEEFDPPPIEVMIYVNLVNLKANKWMLSIVDEMLEIYLLVAKMIHEIRQLDIVEVNCFLDSITNKYRDFLDKEWNDHLVKIVDSALKMFENECVIERYFHSSDVGVVYCLLPFQEERLLHLINEISQFV